MAGLSTLHLVLSAVALLSFSSLPTLCSAQRIPSYAETMSKAVSMVNLRNSGTEQFSELRKSWPLLFSPTLFEHELVMATEHLAKAGRLDAELSANVSTQCVEHMTLVLSALVERKGWAWQMVDAMGKPLPDLKQFNLNWLGAYKECLNVRAMNTSSATSNSSLPSLLFSGQYCSAHVVLQKASAASPFPAEVVLGVCVPDSCSAYDLSVLLNIALAELKIKLPQYAYATCQETDQPLNGLAIAGIAVVAVFLLLMVLGTAVDIIYIQIPTWRTERMGSMCTNLASDYDNQQDDVVLLGTLPIKIPEPRFAAKLLMAFSVYTNGAKLLSTEQTAGSLTCVHGVRFLSMTWVVLGHCFIMPAGAASNLLEYITEATQRWTFQAIENATVSVDSFFVLSGLLVAYLSLKEMKRMAGKMNWFKFYFHRFWRLTPPYMLIILVYVSLGSYWGSGPQWVAEQPDRENCKTSWWTNLLYINNFVHTDKGCLGQSWYLANDMQFYILSPLIFVPFYFSPLLGAVSALLFLLATTVTAAALTMKDHFGPNSLAPVDANATRANYQIDYYVKPYTRMGPYIMGMLAGYMLYRTECRLKINKVVNLVCWAVATASALAVLYGLYHACQGHPVSLPVAALYNAVGRTVWGASVAWVVFACVTGNGGYVNTILSWKALVPLSRLTYCIYLLHIVVVVDYIYSRDTLFYYTDANVIILFLALLVVCYMLSAVVSLAFEAPMLALEKLILSYKKNE